MTARHAVKNAYSLERMASDYAALYATARRPMLKQLATSLEA